MKKLYCPHCPQEFTRRWNMKRHISKMHPTSILGEYLPKTSTDKSTLNVYSRPMGSANYAVDRMWGVC